ncbi:MULTISPECIES: CU044_5270 family protein [unclassified Streptomyces]|uniref:CU044_5270 family protein n=1 Tax=unclassified Streptomyces TaxID=2593676 RepID=UPI00381699B8
MTDELELLRQHDPAPPGQGPWRERELTPDAERRLNGLLHGARPRTWRRRVMVIGAASGALLVALTFTLSDAGSTPAAAVPVALQLRSGALVPLAELARRAEATARAAGPDDGPSRGSHLQSWYMSMESGPDAAPPVVVPEEHITHWNADGSGSEMVVATDPQHPGRPVIHDDDGTWRTVNDGKVLHHKTYPAGSEGLHSGLASRTRPPTDPDELRETLSWLYGDADEGTTQLLQALSSYRDEWTPGPRETAAIARMLADTGELKPAGAVTDRLGRHGQAYVYRGHDGSMDGARQMVILDPVTGDLLGNEITVTEDLPDFRLKAGDVMSYEAWMP